MPLFEYRCQACAHLEEVLQKHTDPAPDPCPACGQAGSMVKAISLTSFQLKGGGWYKDLYASSSAPTKPDGATNGGGSNGGGSPDAAKGAAPAPATGTSTSAPAAPAAPATAKPEAKAAPAATTSTASA